MNSKPRRIPQSRFLAAAVTLATLLSPVACLALPVAAVGSGQSRGLETSSVQRAPAGDEFQVAAGRKAGGEAKVPERGSSASLYGGSSADRYGGSSADRSAVAGERDSRLYRKQTKHESDTVRNAKPEEDRQDEEEE